LFEVPVFRTAASPSAPEPPDLGSLSVKEAMVLAKRLAQEREPEGEQARAAQAPEKTLRPVTSRIVVHPDAGGGVRIEYPAPPLFLGFAAWWLLTLPLYVVLPLDLLELRRFGPLAGLALAFGLNAVPGYLMVYHWPRRLVVGPREITVSCGLWLFGARRRMPTAEAGRVEIDPRRTAILRTRAAGVVSRSFFVAPPVAMSHAEARWLASEIEAALDTYRPRPLGD
jgi:hypothetical protein